MKRSLRSAVPLLFLLGALGQGLASAAPTPVYSVTCAVGGQTRVEWQRAKLDQVTIQWVAPTGSTTVYEDVTAPVSPRPPRGFVLTATATGTGGVDPAIAVALFERADGSGTDEVRVPCT